MRGACEILFNENHNFKEFKQIKTYDEASTTPIWPNAEQYYTAYLLIKLINHICKQTLWWRACDTRI